MNRRMLPLCTMLIAGGITVILTSMMNYSMKDMLTALLMVFIIFYFIGSVLKWTLEIFEMQNQKKAMDEGEVIEKEAVVEETENQEPDPEQL